uniref:Ig-like domain-containing protein n=1 Tax=Gallus gallus TaxID=9031 RepID=A0A8V1A373_CHICK
ISGPHASLATCLQLQWVSISDVVSGVYLRDEIHAKKSAVMVQAGWTETLQCTYSSSAFYICVAWYRQLPNRSLQYLLQSKDVEGRAMVSRDNSRSVSSLYLRALRPQDSAHYLCAVRTGTGNPTEL